MKDIKLTPIDYVAMWLFVIVFICLIMFASNCNDFQPVNEGMNGNIGGAR